MKKIKLIAAILILHTFCMGQIIYVPTDQPTIQAAIDAAIHSDTILVEDGTYFENINFKGKAITVASHYLIDGDEEHIDNTIIDGSQFTNPDSASTVMFVNGEDTTSVICGFTITGGGGLLVSSISQFKLGGGIACWESGAKILNNKIIDNTVAHPSLNCGGAGIGGSMEDGDFWIVVDNNIIENNLAAANAISSFGGGIYTSINSIIQNNIIQHNNCYNSGMNVDGGGIEIEQISDINPIISIITNNDIQYNTLEGDDDGWGAGIMVISGKTFITANTISNNSVIVESIGNGGGIFFMNLLDDIYLFDNDISNNSITTNSWARGAGIGFWFPLGEISIEENTFDGNTVDAVEGFRGTGIWLKNPTNKVTISNNVFSENVGPIEIDNHAGGGICLLNTEETEVIIDANYFIDNAAYNGGGLYARTSYNLLLTNNVFVGNASYIGAGIGIYLPSKKSNISTLTQGLVQPLLVNNTFFNNTAINHGGAIHLQCETNIPIIFNSVFWENDAVNGKEIYYFGSNEELIISYSDIKSDYIQGNWNGEGNIEVDPEFIDELGHIDNTSQCIDAGVTSFEINGEIYFSPDHDIDGQFRPLNASIDMGADEVLLTDLAENFKTQAQLSMGIHPNPFNSATTIKISTLKDNFISLEVYDLTGKEIEILLSEQLSKGNHEINWNVEGLDEGIYFIRLKTEHSSIVCKAVIMK